MIEPTDGAAIVAGAARLCQRKSGPHEERFGVFLQAAWRKIRQTNGAVMTGSRWCGSRQACRQAGSRPRPDRESDRWDRGLGAELGHQPVIASARHQRLRAVALGMQLELEARIIVEAAPERGGKARRAGIDAACGHEADAALERIDGRGDVEFCVSGERPQPRDRIVGVARDRKESLDQIERVAGQGAALQGRLFQETVGDLRNRSPADIGGAGDRHQIGHQRQRRLAVGAGQCREHALIFVAGRSGRERQPFESCSRLILQFKSLISRRRHTG